MKHRRVIGTLTSCLGLALGLAATHVLSAQQKPVDPTRPQSENVAKVNLGEVGLPAGAASVTRFTYAPGKAMPPHTYTGRTSIIVIVQGQLTERLGAVVKVYKAGDVATVAEGATHANENAGNDPLIYAEINITGPARDGIRAGPVRKNPRDQESRRILFEKNTPALLFSCSSYFKMIF